jgi:two-component sensor histidine kinase
VKLRLTLAQRIIAITAAALVPILAALAWNEAALRESRWSETGALALSTAEQASLEMGRLTAGAEGILRAIAASPAVQSLGPETCEAYLARIMPALPQFTRLAVLDLDGVAICGSNPEVRGLDFSDRPYFVEALANGGELVVGEYTLSRVDGSRVLPFALAVVGDDGALRGVVATAMDLDWLGATLRTRQLARNGSLTIADRSGMILAREPEPERFVGTAIPEAFQPLVRAPAPGTLEVTSQDGTQRILGYVPPSVGAPGLYVSAGIARAQAFGPVNAATRRTLAFVLASALLAGLLSWLLGGRLVRGPVDRIASAIAARRSGDRDARTGMEAADGEIEALGAAFDEYMDELERRHAERDRAEERLRATAAEKEDLARRSELLAQEMSHRVMNGFQLMESLFALQTRRVTDPAAQAVIGEAGERLRAMALVHRQLFRLTRDEMQDLDATGYLSDLVREIGTAFTAGGAIGFDVQGDPGLRLSPARGIALGLLVTELVLNAIKHAFEGRGRGLVRVSLRATEDGRLRLVVADDGRGLGDAGGRTGATGGVGLRLVESFLRQLEGVMLIEGPPGTRVEVTFPR